MSTNEEIAALLLQMHARWQARQTGKAAAEPARPGWDRPPTEEELRDRIRLLAQQEAETTRRQAEGHKALTALASRLEAEHTRLGDLQAARARLEASLAERPARPAPACLLCQDVGRIHRDVPPEHPQFGRAQLCPRCGYTRLRARYEQADLWPVPSRTLALATEPIEALYPELVELIELVEDILAVWPRGLLACIDGAHGTAKTHALSILYHHAWKNNQPAIYVPSARRLEEIFTQFDKEEALLTSPDNAEDKVRTIYSRTQRWDMLVRVPWLLIDEAHRYTRKDGSAWVETQMADLIDQKLAGGTSLVLAGNGMSDGVKVGKGKPPGPNPLHPSVLDRASSADAPWIDLTELPSGRPLYSRNVPGWRKPRSVDRKT